MAFHPQLALPHNNPLANRAIARSTHETWAMMEEQREPHVFDTPHAAVLISTVDNVSTIVTSFISLAKFPISILDLLWSSVVMFHISQPWNGKVQSKPLGSWSDNGVYRSMVWSTVLGEVVFGTRVMWLLVQNHLPALLYTLIAFLATFLVSCFVILGRAHYRSHQKESVKFTASRGQKGARRANGRTGRILPPPTPFVRRG